MSRVPHLPAELITAILAFVDATYTEPVASESLPNEYLIACSLVSHQFRSIVEPWIYRKVVVPSPYEDGSEDETHPTLRLLTRTLASRPDLGAAVQDLSIDYLGERPKIPSHTEEDDVIDLSAQEIADALDELDDENVRDDYDEIIHHSANRPIPAQLLVSGDVTGLFITLLHHLLNLRILKITARNGVRNVAYAALGGYGGAGSVPAGLCSIKKLSLWYDDTEGGFSSDSVVPFFALPSLQEFEIGNYAGYDAGGGWLRIPDGSTSPEGFTISRPSPPSRSSDGGFVLTRGISPITRLTLYASATYMTHLRDILMLPSALRSLTYEMGEGTGDAWYIARDVLPGLEAQKDTLEEFAVDASKWTDFGFDNPLFGSMSSLHALKHLTLPAHMLLNPSSTPTDATPLHILLPPSLVTLEIRLRNSGWTLERFLRATGLPKSLRGASRELPALRKVAILGSHEGDIVREAMAQMPRLVPPIELVL